MRCLPMILMALLLALAPPALAASGKDRANGTPARAKVTATAQPAMAKRPVPAAATAPRGGRAQASAPSSRGRAAASAPARGRATASARASGRSTVAARTAPASRKYAATPAQGREARLTWTSYGGRHQADRFLSSAAAATPKAGCGKRSRRGGCGTSAVSWHRDLPPAANVQAMACPAGTMATLATGHSDVVRCMPL